MQTCVILKQDEISRAYVLCLTAPCSKQPCYYTAYITLMTAFRSPYALPWYSYLYM